MDICALFLVLVIYGWTFFIYKFGNGKDFILLIEISIIFSGNLIIFFLIKKLEWQSV